MNINLLSQTYFKSQCRFTLDNEPNGFGSKTFTIHEQHDNNWYYVKTDYLNDFIVHYKPNSPFVLYTGRSDHPIDSRYIHILNDENLEHWYSVNVNLVHPKLSSMPLGLMDSWWYEYGHSEYGNNKLILDYMDTEKTKNVYMNFNVQNNLSDRGLCKQRAIELGIEDSGSGLNSKSYADYLFELSSHRFCLCPNGNGIDTHRFWEALYVKTIPIVTMSINVNFYKHFPCVILDSWDQLSLSNLSYKGSFNEIYTSHYCN